MPLTASQAPSFNQTYSRYIDKHRLEEKLQELFPALKLRDFKIRVNNMVLFLLALLHSAEI